MLCIGLALLSAHAEAAGFSVFGITNISLPNLAVRIGTVTLNASTGAIGGSGFIASSAVARGQIIISRTSAVTVSVLMIAPPANITCSGTAIPITSVPYDDTACSLIAATGICTIYIGLVMSTPSTLTPGTCVTPTLSITVG